MGVTKFTIVDLIATIITLGLAVTPVLLILILMIYKAYKRSEKRAQEKIEIETQNTLILQKRLEDINNRLHEIEKTIKNE